LEQRHSAAPGPLWALEQHLSLRLSRSWQWSVWLHTQATVISPSVALQASHSASCNKIVLTYLPRCRIFPQRGFLGNSMTIDVQNWALHRKAVTRPLRSTILASTAAFSFLVWIIINNNFESAPQYLFVVITSYLSSCFFIVWTFFRNTKSDLSIIARDGVLSIPRVFLNYHSINLREIKSVEKYGSVAILIAPICKSPILVEQKNFESIEAFETFFQFLMRLSPSSQCRKEAQEIKIIEARRENNGVILMLLLTLSMLATYAASKSSSFEQISQGALAVGGLIKGTIARGEFYRIASSFFLHSTPFHLGLNILSLAIIGQRIEILFGRVRFVNILFASAITGSLLSLSFSSYETVIGASGGIFGLFGAYFFVCITSQQQLPGSVSVSVKTLSIILSLQILFDLISDGVDICSHIGGFMFGFVYVRLILRRYMAVNAVAFSLTELFAALGMSLAYVSGITYFFYQYVDLQ
jgi:membrane associated rhomboid family serine protease